MYLRKVVTFQYYKSWIRKNPENTEKIYSQCVYCKSGLAHLVYTIEAVQKTVVQYHKKKNNYVNISTLYP